MADLRQYLPSVYENNTHMHSITDTEEVILDELNELVSQEKDNLFILTAGLSGIERYEEILGIKVNPGTEDLEFRRQRVLSRYSMSPPFSMEYLKEKLDSTLGVDKYLLHLDSSNYTLYVESSAENQSWYQEILVMMNRIKPANIVFINTPLIPASIMTTEQINASAYQWNYKLGVSWKLGDKSFASLNELGVIKLASTNSITDKLLNNLATFTASDITKVRINGEHIITEFKTKTVADNVVTIEYNVFTDIGVNTISLVELLDSNSNVLTSATVYVPLVEDVMLKHTLIVKEG